MTLSESSWKIAKGNLHINHGVRYNNLYQLTMISREGSLNGAELLTPSLWHVDSGTCHKLGLKDFRHLATSQSSIMLSLTSASIANMGNRPKILTLRDGTKAIRADPQWHLRADAQNISKRCTVLHHVRRWLYTQSMGLFD